jgi:hypothetical protein
MLPQTVRVKLSSEAAEAIAITPVVVQELPVRELIEHMLGVTGKDLPRMREVLLRGSMVSGASRFRWAGWAVEEAELAEVLATFPEADSSRTFSAERCVRVVLRGGRAPVDLRREQIDRKGLFQRSSFWGLLMEVVGAGAMRYVGYSYRDKADRFVRELSVVEADRLRAGSDGVKYNTLREQIRVGAFTSAEVYVVREGEDLAQRR